MERQRRDCKHCGKRLVAIGSSRRNGSSTRDWGTRKYHKKCWLELRDLSYCARLSSGLCILCDKPVEKPSNYSACNACMSEPRSW